MHGDHHVVERALEPEGGRDRGEGHPQHREPVELGGDGPRWHGEDVLGGVGEAHDAQLAAHPVHHHRQAVVEGDVPGVGEGLEQRRLVGAGGIGEAPAGEDQTGQRRHPVGGDGDDDPHRRLALGGEVQRHPLHHPGVDGAHPGDGREPPGEGHRGPLQPGEDVAEALALVVGLPRRVERGPSGVGGEVGGDAGRDHHRDGEHLADEAAEVTHELAMEDRHRLTSGWRPPSPSRDCGHPRRCARRRAGPPGRPCARWARCG